MNNILIWIGIVALSLQDYFKKQPVKTTRQQQFLQTGATAQAFIAGNKTTFAGYKKILSYYFGKPIKVVARNGMPFSYNWYVKEIEMKLYNSNWTLNGKQQNKGKGKLISHYLILEYKDGTWDNFNLYDWNSEEVFPDLAQTIFIQLKSETNNEDYQKLLDVANSGDWELALEIAKGQGLI